MVWASDYFYSFMWEIKNNAWITVNNDFWPLVMWFANYFHEWQSHVWKSSANHITSDQNSLFTVTNVLVYLLHTVFVLNTQFRKKQSSIAHFAIVARTVSSDLALWRHHSRSVTSRESDVIALRRHIRRLFLYAQIGANAMFTSE